jgi:hypothetical protein
VTIIKGVSKQTLPSQGGENAALRAIHSAPAEAGADLTSGSYRIEKGKTRPASCDNYPESKIVRNGEITISVGPSLLPWTGADARICQMMPSMTASLGTTLCLPSSQESR